MWWIFVTVCLLAPPDGRIDYASCQQARVPGHYQAIADCRAALNDRRRLIDAAVTEWRLRFHHRDQVHRQAECRRPPRDA